jgi:hypothetical protein
MTRRPTLLAVRPRPLIAFLAGLLMIAALPLLQPVRVEGAIYWGDGPPISRVNLDGSFLRQELIPQELVAGSGTSCGGVAVNSTSLFWANPVTGEIGRSNLDGTDVDYGFITGATNPCGIALDGSHIYWTSYATDQIGRADLDGSHVEKGFLATPGHPCGVAVGGGYIYWADLQDEWVGRESLGGTAREPHLIENHDHDGVCGIAVDEHHLYWGGFGDAIGRANLDGTDPEPRFIGGIEGACGLAVDETHLYWAKQSYPGEIGRANLDGSEVDPNLLSGLTANPCGIAVNGYEQPPPPKLSKLSFGPTRYNRAKAISFLALELPAAGTLSVTAPSGVRWRLPPNPPMKEADAAAGEAWLRLWVAGHSRDARIWRKEIARRGRARIVVEVHYTEDGEIPTTQGTRTWLISR